MAEHEEGYWAKHHTGIIQCFFGFYCAVFSTWEYFHPRSIPAIQTPDSAPLSVGAGMNYSMPFWLWIGILGLVLSVMIPAIIGMIRRSRKPPQLGSSTKNLVRDNSGKVLQAGSIGTYNEAQPIPEPAPPVERPKPNLISHGIQKEVQDSHNYVFDTKRGDVIYTLRVENSLRGAIIQGAMAHIKFIGKERLLGTIDTAYWYGEMSNEAGFPLSKTRCIVLGMCANGCWYHFNNSMRYLPQFDRGSYSEPDPPRSFALDDSCTMKVEVFNPYKGDDVYLEKSFVITPIADGCTITESQ